MKITTTFWDTLYKEIYKQPRPSVMEERIGYEEKGELAKGMFPEVN